MRNESEKRLGVVGVDYGYLWSRVAQNTGDVVEAEDDYGDPPDGVRRDRKSCVGEKPRDVWILSYLLRSKGISGRNIAVLSQELMAR